MEKLIYTPVIYFLRLQIIVQDSFFLTRFYLFFVLLVILGFQCEVTNSPLHLFSQKVVWFVLLSSLFLSVLLNLPFLGEKAQFFIGKSFLSRYLPGPLKGLLPFAFFLFTICLLNYVEAYTHYERILEYNRSVEMINHSLDQIANHLSDENLLKDLQVVESQIYERLPPEFPSTGVLKGFSNSVVSLIEGKK